MEEASFVNTTDNSMKAMPEETGLSRDYVAGIATAVVICVILVIILVAIIIYKSVASCQGSKDNGSIAEDEKPEMEIGRRTRWASISEDNPHNKWSTTELYSKLI